MHYEDGSLSRTDEAAYVWLDCLPPTCDFDIDDLGVFDDDPGYTGTWDNSAYDPYVYPDGSGYSCPTALPTAAPTSAPTALPTAPIPAPTAAPTVPQAVSAATRTVHAFPFAALLAILALAYI